MKNFLTILVFTFIFFACYVGTKLPVESKQATIDALNGYLADGVVLDDQRPMVGILSEQEVLLKAADIAVNQGVLDPSFYMYEREPALWTAKIEAPILVHRPNGEPRGYMLHAIDESGTVLVEAYVRSEEDVKDEDFLSTLSGPSPNRLAEDNAHYITKREVNDFLHNTFPDKILSEPVALSGLRLEDRPHSNTQIFWYFQVDDQGRSLLTREEYIIDALIISNFARNENGRSVISSAYRGSPHLNGYRMAKLSRPLNFQYYTRNSSRNIFANSTNTTLMEPMGFTGVPLE